MGRHRHRGRADRRRRRQGRRRGARRARARGTRSAPTRRRRPRQPPGLPPRAPRPRRAPAVHGGAAGCQPSGNASSMNRVVASPATKIGWSSASARKGSVVAGPRMAKSPQRRRQPGARRLPRRRRRRSPWPAASRRTASPPTRPPRRYRPAARPARGRRAMRPASGRKPCSACLGRDARLDRVAPCAVIASCVSGTRLAARDADLPLHQVLPGDRLGDGVLDLQPGVHLQEPRLVLALLQDELDGA